MPVSIEILDLSPMSQNEMPVPIFKASVPAGVLNAGVTFVPPTGNEPICIVSCREDNKEADIYYVKEHRYLPVYESNNLWQIAVSNVNEDEFPQQRIATLTPDKRSYQLEVRSRGQKTGRWVNFFLEE